MNERYLLILLAVLLLGSVGAFFLYVPILPVLEVVVILSGLVAMFLLGWVAGQRPDGVTRLSHWIERFSAMLRVSATRSSTARQRVWQTESRSHP